MLELRIDRSLRLREAQLCDALEIFASIREQRKHLERWLPHIGRMRCLNDTVLYLRGAALTPPQLPVCTIRVGAEERFAGLIGLHPQEAETETARIDCWLREEFQGQGIATRAVSRLCRYAFCQTKLQRIEAKCATRNLRSIRTFEQLGFRLRRIEYRSELLTDGHRTNLKVYTLDRRPPLQERLLHALRTDRSAT